MGLLTTNHSIEHWTVTKFKINMLMKTLLYGNVISVEWMIDRCGRHCINQVLQIHYTINHASSEGVQSAADVVSSILELVMWPTLNFIICLIHGPYFHWCWDLYQKFMNGCENRGLLSEQVFCSRQNCENVKCKLYSRERYIDGSIWWCKNNHEISIRHGTFLEKSKFCIQDIFIFIIGYLEGTSLYKLSVRTGMSYSNTCVDWAHFLREIFMKWVRDNMGHIKFRGIIELDDSLFGHRVQYHRGEY